MLSNYPISFFESLGKLFYAVSATDGNIDENEIEIVSKLVNTLWEHAKNSEQIEITFNNMVLKNASSAECFKDFVSYKNKNKSLFTPELSGLIKEVSGAIASSFSKKNKSELILLAKLEYELRI